MRYVIIGDVHGCLKELVALLDKIGLSPTDRLVFVGDLVDKGPDSIGVVRLVRDLATKHTVVSLMGNHEEKLLRFLDKLDAAPQYIQSIATELTHEDIRFLQGGPFVEYIPDHRAAVLHGGVLPAHDALPATGEDQTVSKQCSFMLHNVSFCLTRFLGYNILQGGSEIWNGRSKK